MKKFDRTFEEKLEQTIADIEEKTSVEVVVAIAPSSDPYIDAYFKGGAILMFVILLFVLYSPVYFPEYLIPVDLVVAFGLGALLVKLFKPLKRLLVSEKRKEQYVRTAANAYFRENGLVETIDRTAFLAYISATERKCELIADKGILNALPAREWQSIVEAFKKGFENELLPKTILDLLPLVTKPFSKFLPPAEDNIDELSNRLRRLDR